jgi:SAM-dependent methyltransferase
MSHKEQLQFFQNVKNAFPDFFVGKKVFEVGSVNINGSIRSFFENCEYLGIDVAPGLGVDVVCQGQDYDGPDNFFDIVVSSEMMEHNPYWAETMKNMIRVCKPGGLVVMTCAGLGRPEHGTERTSDGNSLSTTIGWNYYKNLTESDFKKSGSVNGLECVFITNYWQYDLYMVGIKNPAFKTDVAKLASIKAAYKKVRYGSWKSIRRAIRLTFFKNKS